MNFASDRCLILLPALALALLHGCAAAPPDAGFADGIRDAGVCDAIEFVADAMPTDVAAESGTTTLTLADAVSRALRHDPATQSAIADVRDGKIGTVPPHLRDAPYAGAKKLAHGATYTYSHDEPFGIAEQQYAPDVVLDAQSPLRELYAGFGFEVSGPEFLEDGIPHLPMRLRRA